MSSRTLRITMIVLVVIGLGVASYLTYVHYAGIKPACTAGESCTKVQTSEWSKLAGVPVALLGLLAYVAILGSLLARSSETSRLATMAITLGGVGFNAYLTHPERLSATMRGGKAGATGLEPATSAVPGQRSNRLSYAPALACKDVSSRRASQVCQGTALPPPPPGAIAARPPVRLLAGWPRSTRL